MSTVIAYFLVVLLGHWCLTVGVYLAGLPVALLLVWAPMWLRTEVASFVGGVAGVAFAVAFGYGVFRFVVGPDSFTVGAFLASTVPLLYHIWRDTRYSLRVWDARHELLEHFRERGDDDVANKLTVGTEFVHGSVAMVAGEIAGLVLATHWFFSR
jgi:hypothetical protein